jgi:light-independent protochlorophyllide reductase subunit N
MVPSLPASPAQTPPALMVVGALADVVEDQFTAVRPDGPRPCAFLPAAQSGAMPPVGPNTRFLLAQPFLADTARALESRGAQRMAAPFPLGVEGTTLAAGRRQRIRCRAANREQATAPAAATRRQAALARHRLQLAGKRIFFFPDSQLEVPLARFSARELGMQLTEVGTPYLHRQHLAEELALLPAGTVLSEGQMWKTSWTAAATPGPTSWSAAWAWPTRWRPRA